VAQIIQKFGDFDGDRSFITLPTRSYVAMHHHSAHTENLFLYDPFYLWPVSPSLRTFNNHMMPDS